MATPGSFTVVSGNNQETLPGEVFDDPVRIRCLDTGGNVMPFEPVVFSVPQTGPSGTFNLGGGTNAPYYTSADASGIASTGIIRANDAVGAWIGAVQFVNALTISAGYNLKNVSYLSEPRTLTFLSGTNQKVALGAAYSQVAVQVKDQTGATFSGAVVQFSVPAGHGTFTGGLTTVTATSNASGNAIMPTFTANNVPGSFTLTVSVPSVSAVVPITTTFTNVDPLVPTTLQYRSGTGQQTAVSTLFAQQLKVTVLNGLGNPVAGVVVTFTSPGAGASCTFPTLLAVGTGISGADGVAASSTPLANAIVGSYAVSATATGATGAQFSLTNGISYEPEVCTTLKAPTSGTNQGTGLAWGSPNSVISTTNSANNEVTNDYADVTTILLAATIPAADLAPIDDTAKITKFILEWQVQGTRTGSYYATVRGALYNGSTQRSNQTLSNDATDTWQTRTLTITTFTGGTPTGAQVKAGNFGVGFVGQGGGGAAGSMRVRGAKVSVCYQNPSGAGQVTSELALQMCEA